LLRCGCGKLRGKRGVAVTAIATIVFRGKIRDVHNPDDTLAYRYIAVPVFRQHHCDMAAFRNCRKYGSYANSDLFPGMLRRISEGLFPDGRLRLDEIPDGVVVDTSGFLAEVIVSVEVD
jgi:hypothetical protein